MMLDMTIHPIMKSLLKIVSKHPEGITAIELSNILSLKYPFEADVQIYIRQALDTSLVRLGKKLRIYP